MNLLIVDDEPLIHISIEYILKNISDQNVTVKKVYNGSEMLRVMETESFDIALIDIRMPGVDGLSAIEKAIKLYPETRYYIMSGFSEFEYARQAVHLGVTDYLLKPLDENNLRQILADTQKSLEKNKESLKENLKAWLAGTLHRHDVSYLYDSSYTSSVTLICNDSKIDNQEPNFLPAPDMHLCSLPCREGTLYICSAQSANCIRNFLRQIPRSGYPTGVTCFVSPISSEPTELADYLHQVTDLCPIRVCLGTGKRYDISRIPSADKNLTAVCSDCIALCESFRKKEYTRYAELADKLIDSVSDLPAWRLQNLCDFISMNTGIVFANPDDLPDVTSTLREAGDSLLYRERGTNRLDSVIAYTDEHFAENLSIAELASRFDFTPNYLSSTFKKHTGINFVEYLTKLRMNKAKELLIYSSQSIKEIGESVGYYSQSHFTKTFIKYESCTPGEYRAKKKGSGK